MIKVDRQYIKEFELVEVEGRLDTAQADELDRCVNQALEEGHKSFLFDLNKLDYISSYGIRIFVKLIRQNKVKISIFIKSESVYEIFEMGALIDILNVKRSLREAIKIFTQIKT